MNNTEDLEERIEVLERVVYNLIDIIIDEDIDNEQKGEMRITLLKLQSSLK